MIRNEVKIFFKETFAQMQKNMLFHKTLSKMSRQFTIVIKKLTIQNQFQKYHILYIRCRKRDII